MMTMEQGKVNEPLRLQSKGDKAQDSYTREYNDDHAIDNLGTEIDLCLDSEIRGWETQETSPSPQQIQDVQGRLKCNIIFWREVLGAPGYNLRRLDRVRV